MIKRRFQPLVFCLILTLSTFWAYWSVIGFDFLNYDDNFYITDNPYVTAGLTWEGVLWAFTTTYANFWHPITWLSHMCSVQLFGLNSGYHHLVNLLLHITNSLLLFVILKKITHTLWRSLFVSLLFALHPLHVESVAWVSARKDVLSTLFWFLTMWSYIHYTVRKGAYPYLFVLLFFILGLLTKPMLVTMPIVLLIIDYWPLVRLSVRTLYEKIPMLLLSLVFGVLAYIAQKSGGALGSAEQFPMSDRIANSLVSSLLYIWKTVWPVNLAAFYPYPVEEYSVIKTSAYGFLFITVSLMCIKKLKSAPYLLAGWLWYLVTLLPVAGLIQVGTHAMADRYTYIPLIGIFIIVVWSAHDLLSKIDFSLKNERVLYILLIVMILLLGVRTMEETRKWRNSGTLWSDEIEKYPAFPNGYNNRGNVYVRAGDYNKAIRDFEKALTLAPEYADPYSNRASLYILLGQHSKALADLDKAIALNPSYVDAYINRCAAYGGLGFFRKAIEECSQAIDLDPDKVMAYRNRAIAYERIGNYKKAFSDYSRAMELDPFNNSFRRSREEMLQKAGP